MKPMLQFAIAVLAAANASASHITVSVTKTPVVAADGMGIVYVAFADEAPAVDVTVSVYSLAGRPSSAAGLAQLQQIDPTLWWHELVWTVRDARAGTEVTIPAASLEVIRASRSGAAINGTTQHRGTFRLPKLSAGDYDIEVSAAGVAGRDSFAVRVGNESPEIRDKYLEREAGRATSYADFKRIQLERLEIMPKRADILLSLGKRAFEAGTLDETIAYYDRAVRVMTENSKTYTTSATPARAAEVRQRLGDTVATINALQAELPRFFARRSEFALVEDVSDGGAMRFVIKERRSGKVLRIIEH